MTTSELAVVKAAKVLADKLAVIHEDPLYRSVWWCAANHGISYKDGPTYERELAALNVALRNLGPVWIRTVNRPTSPRI